MKSGIFLLCLLLFPAIYVFSQTTPSHDTLKSAQAREKTPFLIDSVDHKLDFSRFLMDMHGFIPLPVIISEPALGDFGIALALVFISPGKTKKGKANYTFPDITGIGGMWTLNNSWGVAGFRQGSFADIGMRYRVILGYAPLNVEFYRNINSPLTGKQQTSSYLFNLKPFFTTVEASENLWKNKIFAGLKYTFVTTEVNYQMKEHDTLQRIIDYFQLDTLIENKENRSNVGYMGVFAEWDNRNSIFTPDRGIRFRVTGSLARGWLGSDQDYQQLEMYTNIFVQPVRPWVSGFMAEWSLSSGDAPFYMLPYIYMRGIPAAQYQGQQVLQFETEQRVDILPRWSLVGFAGTGRTFSTNQYLEDKTWYWAGGTGFRYLIARIFRFRVGVDLAMGPDGFAYYIVFGHYWDR